MVSSSVSKCTQDTRQPMVAGRGTLAINESRSAVEPANCPQDRLDVQGDLGCRLTMRLGAWLPVLRVLLERSSGGGIRPGTARCVRDVLRTGCDPSRYPSR